MECVQGKAIVGGTAIGTVCLHGQAPVDVKRSRVEDTERENERYKKARAQAAEELQQLYEKALQEVGEINAQIFEVHRMMLEDEDYNNSVTNMIMEQNVNAEYAVAMTSDNFSRMFEDMEDEYFKARSVDIRDISERILMHLTGTAKENKLQGDKVILLAEELTPSETIQMDKDAILAFVTHVGSANSHTAILARSMNIPAITEISINRDWDGKTAAVDGATGMLYIDPEEEILQKMRDQMKKEEERKLLLDAWKGKETVTSGGRRVELYANIGNESDVASVLANDAEGVGLFRTEFLYLERTEFPTEQEQFQTYKYVAENLAGKKLVIRTLDIGADKQADYFELEKEENPAMGMRAIRICLTRKDIFKTQLRAILRASAFGNISVMFPMIASLWEVQEAKKLLEEAKGELSAEGIAYKDVEIGIMIETPAAVMISRELAKEVDFFSIGTNDLTQYTLAIDRQNQKLDAFYDAHHPAVLAMLQMVIENAHAEKKWVGICGELAADEKLTGKLVEMGVDELSVSPGMVLPIRKAIAEI